MRVAHLAWKERLATDVLADDASDTPHIYRTCVLSIAKEQLGWPVPASKGSRRVLVLLWRSEWPRQPEVPQLQGPAPIDKEIA